MELIDFTTKVGLFNFLITLSGLAFFWFTKIELDRSECIKKGKVFTIGKFVHDNWPAGFSSAILVLIGTPLIIVEKNITSQIFIFAIASSGGYIFKNIVQIALNYFNKK